MWRNEGKKKKKKKEALKLQWWGDEVKERRGANVKEESKRNVKA